MQKYTRTLKGNVVYLNFSKRCYGENFWKLIILLYDETFVCNDYKVKFTRVLGDVLFPVVKLYV
jgi:hypothetical protein